MRLIDELKRRKVFRVAVVYSATAFVVLQAAELLASGLGLPEWLFPALTVLLILGFPIALVLAWALELTPDGVRVTEPGSTEGPAGSGPPLLGRRTVLAAATLTVLSVGLGAGWFLRPVPAREPGAGVPSADGMPADRTTVSRSVAVLPFADLSEAGDQVWFADGLTEEILNSLARLPELKVTARTSSFQFRDTDRDIRAIADTLGVANVVEGSVRRIGDRLRVTAQLIRAGDGFHLWSDTYDRGAADLFEVQRDVAENIAATLNVFLDEEKRERMFASGTRSVAAFEEFRRGQALFWAAHARQPGVTLAQANRHFERAIALDSGYAQAAVFHSDLYGHLVMEGPAGGLIPLGEVDLGLQEPIERLRADLELAADRAPDALTRAVADINRQYFSTTWHRIPGLLEAIAAVADGPIGDGTIWLTEIQLLAGDLETVRRFAERQRASDPLVAGPWMMLVDVELHRRDFDAARALLAEARRRAGDHRWLREADLLIAQLQGDRARAIALLEARQDEQPWYPAYLAAIRGDRESALRLVSELDQPDDWPSDQVLTVYHELGDTVRNRSLARRIDALPAGPAILARLTSFNGNALVFDLRDTPNFTARLAEAGIDPDRFQPMPRLSVGREGQ